MNALVMIQPAFTDAGRPVTSHGMITVSPVLPDQERFAR